MEVAFSPTSFSPLHRANAPGKIALLAVPEIAADKEVSFVIIEEFILVAKGRTGFLMAPHMYRARKENGEKMESTARWMKLELKIHGTNYAVMSGYAPTR